MNTSAKILSTQDLPAWRKNLENNGRKLVCTNGCFDILHAGHVTYLEAARGFGDALLVGLNSDASVRELKGDGRPVNNELDRARVLAALACVDAVVIFHGKRATLFLEMASPDVYVKGGDYTLETLDVTEREVVLKAGAEIRFVPMVAGKSTTATIERMR